jgi:chromosome segregation ATPase
MTDEQKQRILSEARETLNRTIQRREEPQVREWPTPRCLGVGQVPYSAPIEDRVEKWKREMRELEAAREAERERMSSHARELTELRGMIARSDQALSQALAAINQMAGAVTDRMDQLGDELAAVHTKLAVLDARFSDLRDDRAPREAKLYDLPNPLPIPLQRNQVW